MLQRLSIFAILEILLKTLNLQQIFRIMKMSMKILYLHWVEGTPQLCQFPSVCNCTKSYLAPLARKLMPNCIPDHCWQIISVDLITELPWSHGYDAIMVVVDHLSKCAHAILMTLDITASRVAWLFRDHVWKLHGLPEEVISDLGTQFVSNFMHSLGQLLKIRLSASTAYHPQMDGQMKQVNQEVEQFP